MSDSSFFSKWNDLLSIFKRQPVRLVLSLLLPAILVIGIVLFTIFNLEDDETAYSFSQSLSVPNYPETDFHSQPEESHSGQNTTEMVDETALEQKLTEAQKINSDVKAWLYFPGTKVDYPVLQAHDNNFYLEKNLEKKYSWWGSIFAHFRNNLSDASLLPRNTVLFGHNKDDGLMFGELLDLSELSYAKEHRYITLTLQGKTTYWEIFSVMDCEVNNEVFYYINANNPSDQEMTDIITQAQERSFFDYGIEVSAQDNILTLSTCTYKYTFPSGTYRDDVRFVVMARLLTDSQTFQESWPELELNSDRRTPKF